VGAAGGVVGEIWVREGRGSKRDPDLSPPSGCDPVICPPSTGNPGPDRPAGRPWVTLTCARRPRVTLISTRRPRVTLLSSGRRAAGGERRAASRTRFHDIAATRLQAAHRYPGDSDLYAELTPGSITAPPVPLARS
jgi:hypothetical protein